MLKTINGTGRYTMVNGGFPASTYVNAYSGSHGVGNVRFNTGTQNLEVFDGNSWIQINSSHANIGLTPDAENALDWAIKKRKEEDDLMRLAESDPTIADLVNQKKDIENKIEVVKILKRNEQPV